MKKVVMISLIAMISVLFISFNTYGQNSQNKSAKTNISFPQKAYSGGMMEVKLGELAQQKAFSDKVKQFGERMKIDHSQANKELKETAQKDNINLPDKMLDNNQNTYNQLSKYSGKKFDEKYMKKMVEDHKEDISAFEKALLNSGNSNIRKWIQQTLPTLKQHLKLAQQTLSSLNQSK